MERSVKAIGISKWQKLSAVQQHAIITRYAGQCIQRNYDQKSFMDFYNKVMDWGNIDRYTPPEWLNERERLENYLIFHRSFSKKPWYYFNNPIEYKKKVPWKPVLKVTVVLDQVITPFNVGSILRVIDNFGFSELIYFNPSLDLNHSNLKRAARGTETWIPIRHEDELLDYLKGSKKPLIALEKTSGSLPLGKWQPPIEPFYLIVGNEVYGICDAILDICDEVVGIPVFGYKNSMNLSHALAIAGYYIHQSLSL